MSAEDRIKAIISAIANIEKRVDAIVADPTVKVYRDEPIIVRASEAEQAIFRPPAMAGSAFRV